MELTFTCLHLRRIYVSALLLLLLALPAGAQNWLGYANSNYAGTNGMYLNPASIVNNRYNFYMNLASLNVNAYNDYINISLPYSAWRVPLHKVPKQYLDANGAPAWNESWEQENLNGKSKNVSFMTEVRGPSFMLALGPKHALAFGTRTRIGVQLLDMNEELARIIRWGTDPLHRAFYGTKPLGYNINYDATNFALNVNAFQEYSLTYSAVLYEKKANTFKFGFTGKRLIGLGSMYFHNDPGGSITVFAPDSVGFYNTSLNMGFVNENYWTDPNATLTPKRLLFSDPLGKGWGMDLGFTYEYRPNYEEYYYKMNGKTRFDRKEVKPKFRLGVAISDLGSIKYDNKNYVQQLTLPPNTTAILGHTDTLKKMFDRFGQDSAGVNGFDDVSRYFSIIAGGGTTSNSFKTKLPATLNLTFDYHLYKGFFINTTYIQSLRKKGGYGLRSFSQLSVTPRFESKWFETAVPFIINNDFKTFNFGLFFRIGPIFFGSDRAGSLLFDARNLSAMDVYAGACIPIVYRRPKDRDKDGVSNKYDLCPDSIGDWKHKGCPDRDGDGIVDKEDRCPDLAGEKKFDGCPDTDKDGIPDSKDACPLLAGSEKLKGCPDKDEDGVIDTADKCPDVKGLAEFNGCPDTDDDGVPDDIDECPNQKGLKQNNGCPEKKPEPKPKEEPKKAEPKPKKAELPADEEKVLQEAYDNLLFETGSAVIKEESYKALDKLAYLLNSKKSYMVALDGYTDNIGDEETNVRLSKMRADAVKKYLVDKGIAAKRVMTAGHGSKNPIASNATPEGRKKNRRVEFLILRIND